MPIPDDAAVGRVLAEAAIDRREARLLLSLASGVAEATLAAFPERQVESRVHDRFLDWARRRRCGEPVAYIVGRREFYGRCFKVSPAVLIPRPETELLVERTIEHAKAFAQPRILDLGTGSGAIAVTLACELPDASIAAVDASAAALGIAAVNAEALAPGRIELIESDWFSRVDGRTFDLIVSNPPYIAAGDAHLVQGDLRFEPHAALVGGIAGMQCIASIVTAAAGHLTAGGWLLLEHGFDQGGPVRDHLRAAGFDEIDTWLDLAGLERISAGKLPAA